MDEGKYTYLREETEKDIQNEEKRLEKALQENLRSQVFGGSEQKQREARVKSEEH